LQLLTLLPEACSRSAQTTGQQQPGHGDTPGPRLLSAGWGWLAGALALLGRSLKNSAAEHWAGGHEGLRRPQRLNLRTDVDPEGSSDPAGLSNDKHRLGQAFQVSSFQAGKLLDAHVQPLAKSFKAQALGLTCAEQHLSETLQLRNL